MNTAATFTALVISAPRIRVWRMERTYADDSLVSWVPTSCLLRNMEVHVKGQQATERWLRLDTPTARDDVQSNGQFINVSSNHQRVGEVLLRRPHVAQMCQTLRSGWLLLYSTGTY